jgi:hypothetical protein
VPLCVRVSRVSRVCPGSPRCLFTGRDARSTATNIGALDYRDALLDAHTISSHPFTRGMFPLESFLRSAVASCVACSKRYPVVTQFFIVTFTTGLYFMSAIFFFGDAEEGEMAPLEAIYFAVVTMSTVGYGDYAPSQDTPYGMVATVFLILVGIIFVFAEISKLVIMLVSPIFEGVRHFIDRLFPQEAIDLDGDGGSDFKVPRGPIVYYGKNLIAPMVIIIGGQFLWAQFYVMADPTWEYPVAVYHCFTTMTTVGYGDVRINVRIGDTHRPALLHHTHEYRRGHE